ncbi:MAG: threonylcarbamoyl-AMP synthase [Chloroflexi bacterium]|nr:threonylcarbamoyl-AMP synthase [Chloroflexota bacterium]
MARRIDDGPDGRAEAARLLAGGAIVAIPTDTVYGIAVGLDTPGGIERLFAAKSRPPDKAIALLLADVAQAAEIGEMTAVATALATAFWPGGLTLVVPRRTDRALPAALTGGDLAPGAIPTVGLRVPDHDAPRALARALGPLPTTSANRSGEPEARDAAEIEALLGHAVDLILDGGPSRGGPASTVVDCTGPEPVMRRAGAIAVDEIARCLESAGLPAVGR